ncbi:MAG: metallophosphoesterase, partial [Thermosphaera sp.]
DLHLGFEEAVARGLDYTLRGGSSYSAMFLPRVQFKKIIETLENVLTRVKVDRVIINGDLKHAFDRLLRQEKSEVRELIRYLRNADIDEVVLIRGNHDNFIKKIVLEEGGRIYNALSLNMNGTRLFITHGHEYFPIDEHDIIIIGHEHPSIRCFGGRRYPVFQKIPIDHGKWIVIQPATGPYHPGTLVTPDPANYLSPYVKKSRLLHKSRVILWVELEKNSEMVDQFSSVIDSPLVRIDRINFGEREFGIIEFADLETTMLFCMYE